MPVDLAPGKTIPYYELKRLIASPLAAYEKIVAVLEFAEEHPQTETREICIHLAGRYPSTKHWIFEDDRIMQSKMQLVAYIMIAGRYEITNCKTEGIGSIRRYRGWKPVKGFYHVDVTTRAGFVTSAIQMGLSKYYEPTTIDELI